MNLKTRSAIFYRLDDRRCIIVKKINIFTQKILYTGYSLEECKSIARILTENQIDYEVKECHTRQAQARGRGTFGELQQYSMMYKICVHHKDYEEAEFLIDKL